MLHILQAILWASLAGIAYTYVGYPLIIAALARLRPRPHATADIEPTVSVLVAAYNEEACIAQKIDNTLALDYPEDKLELVIVTDGSNDRTPDIVRSFASPRVRLLHEVERRGKSAAIARAFPATRGEIVLFSDANCFLERNGVRRLVRHFADPAVGGASGAKRMLDEGETPSGKGEGLYWRYESFLKACDSAVSSAMGAPGEVWAVRREAFVPPEEGVILDDFVASLRLVEAGWRLIFDPQALAFERSSASLRGEWVRRTRNAAGGWQAWTLLPGMRSHPSRLVRFQYLSHRMLRWMVTPSLFVLALATCVALGILRAGPLYDALLAAQIIGYGGALAGWVAARRGHRPGWLMAPLYVVMLNAAALVGGLRHLTGRQSAVWQKAR
ncbi:MAG TPA: glycosyltransferase family 2 protein [Chloroflexi bacterium]|nr:glycosyltransferase family 2 protein [Chloroflexota bacterium]